MNYTAPRGTKDVLPPDSQVWQKVEAKFRELCERFSYGEIRTPTFEQTELFARGVGDATDVVRKEMYNFEDKGGRAMTLRPEGTAGVVRAYLEHGLASLPSPQKLFYLISAFRYEKMQKGRYREFAQLGCECFGSAEPSADAEIISLLWLFFSELGMNDISLQLNSIGCPDCRPAYLDQLRDYLRPHLGDLCEDCQKRFEINPMRILDCKQEACQAITQDAPAPLDTLCPSCQDHWEELLRLLDFYAIPYTVNKRIVRGLDYYTRTVFEFISDNVGSQGTICGGGRYDGLVEELGGQATPAVGFALGVERLLLELEAQDLLPQPDQEAQIFIASFPAYQDQASAFAYRLRSAGIHAEADILGRSFKAQLKHANRMGATYLMVFGEEEAARMNATIKRMADGEEFEMSFDELVQFLLQQL
ncbi:MAG: histidine--tRNA ligase [Eubacteriales bacterium]|nr:histidine--tRNA ligase [Clostridiales bacterium]MDY5836260.1 histidine--tRNA ligase [Eubacteriales bacterium]